MSKIAEIIKEKGLKPADCAYHTIRESAEVGKVRALLIKGQKDLHVEYTCPFCQHSGYIIQPWVEVSKAAKIKFSFKCEKCQQSIKVPKLKGGPKEKK